MLLIGISFSLIFSGCYLIKQGRYLIHYQRKAEKISKVLEQDSLSCDIKDLLTLTKEIIDFSVDQIGLVKDDNFTRYVEIEQKNVVYVVSAASPTSFEKYTWKFPLFGSFPYKGFFVLEDAKKQAEKLKEKGYDVYLRGAGAFSTLGFFSDPIYSYMKDYSVFGLASIIIHEQTHATKFIKNQVQFNEEMASFVGDEGALWFIRQKYGMDSQHYTKALSGQKDFETFVAYLRQMYDTLTHLYSQDLPKEEILTKKKEIISEFQNSFAQKYDTLFLTDRFKGFIQREVNNAYLNSYMTYNQDLELFYALYEKNNHSLAKTVELLKSIDKKDKDPKKSLREILQCQSQ